GPRASTNLSTARAVRGMSVTLSARRRPGAATAWYGLVRPGTAHTDTQRPLGTPRHGALVRADGPERVCEEQRWAQRWRYRMDPRLQRSAGIAGVLAGIALAGEFTLFMISGFTPQTFSDAAHALPFLQDHGAYLRAAAVFGAVGVALTTLFLVG